MSITGRSGPCRRAKRTAGPAGRGSAPLRPPAPGQLFESDQLPDDVERQLVLPELAGRNPDTKASLEMFGIFDRMRAWGETIVIVTHAGARWKLRPSCWRAGAYCTSTRTALEAVRPSMRRAWKTCSPAASLHRTV